jgi:MFS family permease
VKNLYLRTVYFANGIFVFGHALVVPIFALFLNDFNIDLIQISFTSTVYLVSTAFFLVILSLIGDRFSRKTRFVAIAYLIRGIVWFSYIFVTSIEQVYFLQVIAGLGEAIGSTFFQVVVAEHLDEGHHVQDYSVWKLIESMAAGLAAVVGGFIVETFNFQVLFGLMAILSVLSTLTFILGMRQYRKSKLLSQIQDAPNP